MKYSLLAMIALTNAALADISQTTISSPGGFVQCGVYTATNGNGFFAGADLQAAYGTGQGFEEHAFAGNQSTQAAVAYNGPPSTNNSAAATAGLGYFRTLTYDSSLVSNPLPAGISNGGWKETFTVNNAALNGQSGFLVFQVKARGFERATGFSGAASLALGTYKNNTLLNSNAFFNAGNSDSTGASFQYVQ